MTSEYNSGTLEVATSARAPRPRASSVAPVAALPRKETVRGGARAPLSSGNVVGFRQRSAHRPAEFATGAGERDKAPSRPHTKPPSAGWYAGQSGRAIAWAARSRRADVRSLRCGHARFRAGSGRVLRAERPVPAGPLRSE